MTGRWVTAVRARVWETVKQPRSLLPYSKPVNIRQCSFHWLLPTSAIAFSLLFLLITRPAVPYNHLSGAIPLTMLDAFHKTPEGCRPPPRVFPLLDYGNGEHQRPHFDWSFGKKPPSDEEKVESPSWLPQDVPPGFERFETNSDSHDEKFGEQAVHCQAEIFEPYNPSNDPMKVSNLGDDILDPLREALKDVDVEHVMIMTLESARKELFPTQPGTPLYDALVKSHRDEDKESAMDKLAHMTLVSQMITGEYALDSQGKPANLSKSEWQDSSAEGMGGINVKGALTGSSLTLKSIMMGHCGVSPLPVDLLEEVNLDIYQPCFPQILELFNRKKNSTGEEAESGTGKSFLERPWKSIFMQPCTDAYDRQHILTKQMGFEQSITKETLMDENATYWHPNMETVNYFG